MSRMRSYKTKATAMEYAEGGTLSAAKGEQRDKG